jgi:hypothetical protein
MSNDPKNLPVKKTQAVKAEIEENVPVPLKDLPAFRADNKKLSVGMNIGCVELGRRLSIVNDMTAENGKRIYKIWGYASFSDYCERELGIFKSKGYDLISLYKHAEEGIFTDKQVETIGWSKVTPLLPLVRAGIITKQNAAKWLLKIEGKTFDEVKQIANLAREKVKDRMGETAEGGGKSDTADSKDTPDLPAATTTISGSVSPEEIFTLRIPLYKDQWENVQVALKKAEKITGSDKQPWLLDCIALAFNSEAFSTKEESLEVLCKRIERVFGVDIVALHSKTKQVVFGDRLAKMLMKSDGPKEKK